MSIISQIVSYVQTNWVEIGVALWLVEQAMRAISILTPWKWDDNLVNVIANAISKLFPKKIV